VRAYGEKREADIDEAWSVHVQRDHGGTSGRRQADDASEVVVPFEVIQPFLISWIE
jgi:hypothetical protein